MSSVFGKLPSFLEDTDLNPESNVNMNKDEDFTPPSIKMEDENKTPLSEHTVAVNIGDDTPCPVSVTNKENGGKLFVAYINGPVDDVNIYIDLIDTLITASENDDYYIYIDSPGGYVASGGIISSAIHHSKANVVTVARGLCASAAALIHSSPKSGNSRVEDFAIMMYHMSSHFDYGSSVLIAERAINQVKYVNELLLKKALDDNHITAEELDKIQNAEEIYIDAEEFRRRTAGGTENE